MRNLAIFVAGVGLLTAGIARGDGAADLKSHGEQLARDGRFTGGMVSVAWRWQP